MSQKRDIRYEQYVERQLETLKRRKEQRAGKTSSSSTPKQTVANTVKREMKVAQPSASKTQAGDLSYKALQHERAVQIRKLKKKRRRQALVFLLVSTFVVGGLWLGRGLIGRLVQDSAQVAYAKAKGLPVEVTNSVGMVMRLVPAGSYRMGSPEDEVFRQSDEAEHSRRLDRALYMAVQETTQAQFAELMGTNPTAFDPALANPVDSVSFDQALRFCNKLSWREGLAEVYEEGAEGWICHIDRDGYRLPVEVEWEFACRAGTTGPFFVGSIATPEKGRASLARIGWFAANAHGRPHEGGRLKANPWGFYDMAGNVREWCWDWYAPHQQQGLPPYTGPASGLARVLRGGSWNSEMRQCRSAARERLAPSAALNGKDEGFRCVRWAK